MDERQANEAIVETAHAALAEGDIAGFLARFDREARLYHAESLPYGGVYSGLDQIRQGLDWQMAAWPDSSFRVEQLTSWADRVIAWLSVCGRSPVTGGSFASPVAESWRLRNRKVIELRVFHWDTHRMLRIAGR